MTSFQNEIIAKPPPKPIKEFIDSMIPPKGIKRVKDMAGIELLDGEEMENDAFEEEDDENDVDTNQLLVALSGNIPIETTSQEPVKESNYVIGKTVSLAGISVWLICTFHSVHFCLSTNQNGLSKCLENFEEKNKEQSLTK